MLPLKVIMRVSENFLIPTATEVVEAQLGLLLQDDTQRSQLDDPQLGLELGTNVEK